MLNKNLPAELTSYDLLKALAVLLMLADHWGYHFAPDDTWWRVAGRLSVPVWFFLIGYARTRAVPRDFWVGGGILTVSSLIAGQYLFPLSILFTLGFARLYIDRIMARALRTRETLAGMFFFLFLLSFPTQALIEYGTLGLLFAMMGYMVRHRADLALRPSIFWAFTAASALAYMLGQGLLLPRLYILQWAVFGAGMAGLCGLLYWFRMQSYPKFSIYARPLLPLLQLLGRRTLEIYVLHLLVFRALAMALYPDRFAFWHFKLFPSSFISLFLTP